MLTGESGFGDIVDVFLPVSVFYDNVVDFRPSLGRRLIVKQKVFWQDVGVVHDHNHDLGVGQRLKEFTLAILVGFEEFCRVEAIFPAVHEEFVG